MKPVLIEINSCKVDKINVAKKSIFSANTCKFPYLPTFNSRVCASVSEFIGVTGETFPKYISCLNLLNV